MAFPAWPTIDSPGAHRSPRVVTVRLKCAHAPNPPHVARPALSRPCPQRDGYRLCRHADGICTCNAERRAGFPPRTRWPGGCAIRLPPPRSRDAGRQPAGRRDVCCTITPRARLLQVALRVCVHAVHACCRDGVDAAAACHRAPCRGAPIGAIAPRARAAAPDPTSDRLNVPAQPGR